MSYFELLSSAKNYSKDIFLQYQILEQLHLYGHKESKEYQEELKTLKEHIELEHMFYNFLEEGALQFIYQQITQKEQIPYTIDPIDLLVEELEKKDLVLYRILVSTLFENIHRNSSKKRIIERKQIGFIPLFPENVDEHFMREEKISAVFNMVSMYQIIQNPVYNKESISSFLYYSSFINPYIENYFLKKDFTLTEVFFPLIDAVIDSYQEEDVNAVEQYYQELFVNVLTKLLSTPKEEWALKENQVDFHLLLDLLISLFESYPTSLAEKYYTVITRRAEKYPEMAEYLFGKIEPIIEKKKQKEYAKR